MRYSAAKRYSGSICKTARQRNICAFQAIILFTFYGLPSFCFAEIYNISFSDVTPRAFSVVWVSSEAVDSAKLHVYADSQGQYEITNNLTISTVSPLDALQRGIVKIDVKGLLADTDYFVAGETFSKSGNSSTFPEADIYSRVHTTLETTRIGDDGKPIANDLIKQTVFEPDGVSAAPGVLVFFSIPGKSIYPVSSFAVQEQSSSTVLVDLNNLYSKSTLKSLNLVGGESVEISQLDGLSCEANTQIPLKVRRLAKQFDNPPLAKIEALESCFSPEGKGSDFNCDGNIGFGDFNLFIGKFGSSKTSQSPNCSFNIDFDLNNDKIVDFGDFNLFLSVFGKVENSAAQP